MQRRVKFLQNAVGNQILWLHDEAGRQILPLPDAAGSQILPPHNAAGSHLTAGIKSKNFGRLPRPLKGQSCEKSHMRDLQYPIPMRIMY